jgi:hypothetical protein
VQALPAFPDKRRRRCPFSTIAVCIFDYEYERTRPIIASLCAMLLVGGATVCFFRAEARNQPPETSMRVARHRVGALDD